ncbi:platelet endothelial cell adhesion molecule isoform X5 [Phodopus roborovskii]|uniref:platelet endothelial cell adhesion molecule isoform X5 n=1 Tax=Phodopus roborovskii TaxID=109678 RepID=UPI0021E4A416|nr:platelet endothelial cell adhesion molecule isoform X5 [Phodopus roborovskii]
MQLRWASVSKMHQAVLLTLLLYSSLQAQENSFTFNSIHMESLPSWEVPNGHNLTLLCLVDISTTSQVRPQHQVLFYKDDILVHNVSSREHTESFFISQARIFHSGRYKCTVILNNKEKTTPEYQVLVKGVPNPVVTLDKKEVTEGGVVTVTCSVKEEQPPIYFTIEKVELDTKVVKQTRQKTSTQNFVQIDFLIEEQDHVLVFRCLAGIMSGIEMQTSESIRSEYVTVQESFSTPKFQIQPPGMITEGEQLYIKCTVQVTHLVREFPEIIIQKDKAIVATSKQNNEAVYSVMAMVENSGHYTCKVESSRISKVSSIMVNITELFPKPTLEFSSRQLDQGKILDLFCSVPGIPVANFTIQKENMVLSQDQNFSKIADNRDSGVYSCTAGIGRVVKRSNPVPIKVCEMLSKPRIFHDAKAEVIKGHAITISCQSINGTTPVTYHLIKATNVFLELKMKSNDPAAFTDKPLKDVEYQCMASNCHSHPDLHSEILRVKVIAKQKPVEMSRPAAPLLNSNSEKVSEPNVEANSHYVPQNMDVEYTEVEVSPHEPHQALGTRATETVYSEIRKVNPNVMENRLSRTGGSLDGT